MPSPENPIEVKFAPEDVESLQRLFAAEWRFRRAFVAGMFSLRERERCQLRLVHPNGGTFSVEAEVVYRKAEEPVAGIGLDLVGLDAGKALLLEMFALSPTTIQESSAATPAEDPATAGVDPGTRTIYAKIRALSLPERQKVARQGQLAERVALERTFGGSVWEALLQNNSLTVPEVATISKKGTLPQPLVAVIVANGGWLASGEVRRALLGNPRVNGMQLDRVLRATPKPELKQIAQLSPYRSQVRMAAKRMLNESSVRS